MIIALANQKGGVGKTTSTINLAHALHQLGKRVLMVDADPQASLTVYAGFDHDELAEQKHTILEVLLGERDLDEVIVERENAPDLVASSLDLLTAENELQRFGAGVLKDALRGSTESYDVILIDTQPSLNILALAALTAATHVLVPVKVDYLSMRGLKLFFETVTKVRRRPNPELQVLGILPTLYNKSFSNDRETLDQVAAAADAMGVHVFDPIPRRTEFDHAAAHGRPTIDLSPASDATKAYQQLAAHIIKHG